MLQKTWYTKKEIMDLLDLSSQNFNTLKFKNNIAPKHRYGATLVYDLDQFREVSEGHKLRNIPTQRGNDPLKCHSIEQRASACLKVWAVIEEDLAKQKLDLSKLAKLTGHNYGTLWGFRKTGTLASPLMDSMYVFYNIARWLGFKNSAHYIVMYISFLEKFGFSEASFSKPQDN